MSTSYGTTEPYVQHGICTSATVTSTPSCLVDTASLMLDLVYHPVDSEYVAQLYGKDSILFTSDFDRSACRLLYFLGVEFPDVKLTSFTANNLYEIVKFIDMSSCRNYLYNKHLKQDCAFLIPTEISVDGHWEDIVHPIQLFHANPQVIRNPFIVIGLAVYLLQMVVTKTNFDFRTTDLSPLISTLWSGVGPEQVIENFVASFQAMEERIIGQCNHEFVESNTGSIEFSSYDFSDCQDAEII